MQMTCWQMIRAVRNLFLLQLICIIITISLPFISKLDQPMFIRLKGRIDGRVTGEGMEHKVMCVR